MILHYYIFNGTKMIRKKIVRIALASILIIAQTSCTRTSSEPVSREEYMLDTICSISVYEMTDGNGNKKPAADMTEECEAAMDRAFEVCSELESKLSRTRENSDISRLNAAGGEWTTVSKDAFELIKKGIEYAELSDGAFDITVGGITELWDFHAPEEEQSLPDDALLREAVKHVGYKNIEIDYNYVSADPDDNRVRLNDPDTKIDLGGIAKGYVGDMMRLELRAAGVTSGIINLGGNVICIGGRPDGGPFVIGVETPFSDRTEIVGRVKADDQTLVTSGVYERKMEIDGRIYHHVLDTRTGYPVDTDLSGITIISGGNSVDADALSTICLIKGYDEALRLIEDLSSDKTGDLAISDMDEIEAVFVKSDGSVEPTAGAAFEKEK